MTNWWDRWRQRRRRKSLSRRWPDLREFVYLDEVSVTSLLSSRLGKVPSEFTDTLTESTTAGINSSIGANAAVLKSSIGSSIESSLTQDTKILSKATIQATFKRLYEGEADHLALRPIHPSEPRPTADDARRFIESRSETVALHPWVIDPARLERGSLVEIQMELQADPIFRLSTMVGTFAELASESKELSAQVDQQGLEKAIEVNRVLEKLMVGLVPLRCRIVDYVSVALGSREYLMHRGLLQQLQASERPPARDIYLVGVAEQSLFWRDIRRVLFSNLRFRAFCRLNHDGLTDAWTPVKLAHVFGEVAPGLERDMALFSSGALNAMALSSGSQTPVVEPGYQALVRFSELLAASLGIVLAPDDYQRIEVLAGESIHLMMSVPDRRKAFKWIADLVVSHSSTIVNPDTVSELRVQACQEFGLLPGGLIVTSDPSIASPEMSHSDESFIDAEIIAIYW
jgi:hypothetical protein